MHMYFIITSDSAPLTNKETR